MNYSHTSLVFLVIIFWTLSIINLINTSPHDTDKQHFKWRIYAKFISVSFVDRSQCVEQSKNLINLNAKNHTSMKSYQSTQQSNQRMNIFNSTFFKPIFSSNMWTSKRHLPSNNQRIYLFTHIKHSKWK